MPTGLRECHRPALARAFQLLAAGEVTTVEEVRWRLKLEGYVPLPTPVSCLTRQLRELSKAEFLGDATGDDGQGAKGPKGDHVN